ncbi:MAG: hypothetical protein RIQ52_641 [Pseudomonadota bacterium]|jgi:hypothetical protein
MQVDDLEGSASLTLDGQVFKVSAGNFNLLELTLKPWGYEGRLGWIVLCEPVQDKINKPFQSNKPIKLELDLMVGVAGSDSKQRVPLKLEAWVNARSFREQLSTNIRLAGNKVLSRCYQVSFIDPARLFWKQHFLQKLYGDTTYKAIITEQLVTEIKVRMDWDVLDKQKKQIMVMARPEGSGCSSFYDFLIWFVYEHNGVFYYDYAEKQYVIAGKKPAVSGKPVDVDYSQVLDYEVVLETVDYASIEVMNASASNAKKDKKPNDEEVKPLIRDYLAIWDVPADFTADSELIKSRPGNDKTVVRIGLSSLPLVMLKPWDEIQPVKEWSPDAWPHDKKFRVEHVEASFTCDDSSVMDHYNADTGKFAFSYRLNVYETDLSCVAFPAFSYPDYPVMVEGIILSDQGDEKNKTFSLVEDKDTAVKYYQAEVPVFDKVKVQLPYQPENMNGQFFFPPYRQQKVRIALWLESSFIDAYVDWRSDTPQTVDSQGNHLVLGQSETSRTTLRHYYSDSKPQLDINRVLEKDTQTITLSEGMILLSTKETS